MVNSPRSFAILAFSLIAAVLLAGGGVLYVERVNQAREQRTLSKALKLGFVVNDYAQDHNGHYPDAGKWEQELTPYFMPADGDILYPVAPIGGSPRRFSLNPAVSGKSVAKVDAPSNIWLFYESVSSQSSASDNLKFCPDPDKDGGHSFAVVYADGHVYLQNKRWQSLCQAKTAEICGGGMSN